MWNEIKLNLIGNADYNIASPNIYKWDNIGELIAYIDDRRSIWFSSEHAWKIARRVCSYLQDLRIQDTTRKGRLDEGQ